MRRPVTVALSLAFVAFAQNARADGEFYLKDGDRVVFYGDSITDQRLYTTFAETFVVTRFPKRDVTFVHSGWGGDRVTGGGGGPIDKRLTRDVFAYKPTVMTVMLGMNDASYRAFDENIFHTYARGYEHIVDSVRDKFPEIRLTLIKPSPFDDVTRSPNFDGGYNAVLVKYGEFIEELAKKEKADVADLNTPVVAATKKAMEIDAKSAEKLNPDRVHPGPSGQLLMAEALLKAWNAPGLVSEVSVKVEGDKATAEAKQAWVRNLHFLDGALVWEELDEALPFPLDMKDPLIGLAVKSSDVLEALDQETLKVAGLADGDYLLKIDGDEVGTFPSAKLAEGVNLATYSTPMSKQAAAVHALTLKHNNIHFTRWRQVQVPLESADMEKLEDAMDALDAIEDDVVKEQRAKAQPVVRRYELVKKP